MKYFTKLFITCYLVFSGGHIFGQVKFTDIPEDKQLYARDVETNKADVAVSGTVDNDGSDYTEMKLKIYRDNDLVETLTEELNFSGSTASFSFTAKITAELKNYTFEVIGVDGNSETVIEKVEEVVAGDAYFITGQSNARSSGGANGNDVPFIRVYDEDPFAWFDGDNDGNGFIGQWGLLLARLIVDNQKIPVAFYNGASGGLEINQLQRNDSDPQNNSHYGRLLTRIVKSGLQNGIRAIFWHQGESDVSDIDTEEYKKRWNNLHEDWYVDYPNIEKIFLFQTRHGCGDQIIEDALIKEAHRQLAEDHDDVEIMSTSASTHRSDDCHFTWENGYQEFGNNVYRLVARDIYGIDADNIEPPQVDRIEQSGDRELTLFMRQKNDTYTWVDDAEDDFKTEGENLRVTSGKIDGYKVILTFSGDVDDVTALSYLGRQGEPEPMVINANGIGTVHFYQFPVTDPVSIAK